MTRFHKLLTLAFVALIVVTAGWLTPASQGDQTEDPDTTMNFLSMMDRYLELSRRWVDMASRDDSAVYLALEGITEIYDGRGAKDKAIAHLERLLADTQDPGKRNLIRFKIRDLYNETGRTERSLEVLDAIVMDNR